MTLRFLILLFFVSNFAHAQYNDYPNTPTIYGEAFGGFLLEKFDEGTKQKYMNAHKINETGRSGYGTAKYTRKRTSAASKKS